MHRSSKWKSFNKSKTLVIFDLLREAKSKNGSAIINVGRIAELLKGGVLRGKPADPSTKCSISGESLLEYAVRLKSNDTARLLLEAGAALAQDNLIRRAVMLSACRSDDRRLLDPPCDLVRTLLNAGADVNARSGHDETPLHYAASPSWLERVSRTNPVHTNEFCTYPKRNRLVKLLIESGAEINAKDKSGQTPLMVACGCSRDFILIGILLRAGAKDSVNEVNEIGSSALIELLSEREADPRIVQRFIFEGADVNARDNRGYTPLHRARSLECVELLLDAGANVNARADGGLTPLMHAASVSKLEVISTFLNAGADANARADGGWTPLMSAARDNSNPEVALALLKAGADVNAIIMAQGRTPLSYAAGSNKNLEVISVLLGAGADVNARDNEGYTPLHWAAVSNENPEVISALLRAGASAKAVNELGETALDLAYRKEGTKAYSELHDASFE